MLHQSEQIHMVSWVFSIAPQKGITFKVIVHPKMKIRQENEIHRGLEQFKGE